MVATTTQSPKSLNIERQITIEASLEIAFEALLEQLGPAAEMPDGTSMPMVFEAWPGGRWFRDLGNHSGHWWGQVQVIKPPMLIEINGPLFMSYPAISHVQYRLSYEAGQTTLALTHRAIGELDPAHCEGVTSGWDYQLQKIKDGATRRV